MMQGASSWVFGANDALLGRGLNHLPYTVFLDEQGARRIGVGIGACVLDLASAAAVLPESVRDALRAPFLNELMALGPAAWAELRAALQFLLSRENRERTLLEAALRPVRGLPLALPISVGDYTDFYTSREHARRVGALFRPEQPLLENYDWVPIAYHGRASSLVVSGTEVRRPSGQRRGDDRPVFAPGERLDYELELGFWIGTGNPLGEPVPVTNAEAKIFGVSLLNDWSARDIQAWEYQPLGPFLGKNFATSVSAWVTPLEALGSARVEPAPHDSGLLDYLKPAGSALRVEVEVWLSTARARASQLPPFRLSRGHTGGLYWTPAQMVAHHTAGGCNLRVGDLLASGTISGVERESAGCLLELTRGGADELTLPNGERRRFLEDGDEVTLVGWAESAGALPIRLGECRGTIAASA